MQVRQFLICLFCVASIGFPLTANAQRPTRDREKEKQWKSMENGPWDFAPDWYYFFLHKKYSGAEMYWKWAGFNSGFRVRFKEHKSNIKRIMPTRVTSEETQRQKVKKVETERKYIEELYKEEVIREADRAVAESAKVLGGFLLGLPHTATYFGQQFFSCGPMWYLVALMLAWVLLDVLLEIFPERYITPAVVGVTLLGWGITLVWEAPFCIAQGMVSLPYLYIGYLAKKRRLFETPLSGRAKAGLIVSALGVVAGVLLTQSTDCVSLGEWTMGPLSILLDGAVGYGIIRLFLKWQRRVDGPISHAIEWVGRRSLFIFCIHTVELTAIPWYLMAAKYADHPVQGMLLQFVFSLVSIFAVTELLMRRKELGRKLRGGTKCRKNEIRIAT